MNTFQLVRDKLSSLPVHPIIPAVVRDVNNGTITVVTASTSSGKSMLLPGALADSGRSQVVVLVPRRFLALDAALNVAELAGFKVGQQVGYALGQTTGEHSYHAADTKLLYCTYGYALASGLINKAKVLVLDEVHEADEQISLSRAILRERKLKEPDLHLLEMSATVDARLQAGYWKDTAKTAIHAIDGQPPACDLVHEAVMLAASKGRTIEEIAVALLEQKRRGIVVFRPGVREVENTVTEIKRLLREAKIVDTDVVGIHGSTPSDQRRLARGSPSPDKRKVIVGTNVIESGVNLRWLDAGVSDGYRKIPYHRDDTGAEALVLENQPQAGLLQQIGRINRDPETTNFPRGLFILHAKKPFEARRAQNGPAIQRQSLNSVAFHAACLDYQPDRLAWDVTSSAHSPLFPERLRQSKEELQRLELIEDDWSLTRDGLFIKHLPVRPETGALLCEARRRDELRLRQHQKVRVMRDAVILAAIMESHGLRKDTRSGHKADQHRTSDLLDALNAFRFLRRESLAQAILDANEAFLADASQDQLARVQQQRLDFEVICLKHNVVLTGFIETARLADEISERISLQRPGTYFEVRDEDDVYDSERYGELQCCLLAAHVNRVFLHDRDGLRDLLRDVGKQRSDFGMPFHGYGLSRSTIVPPLKDNDIVVGGLREVQGDAVRDAPPLLVVTDVSVVPRDIFILWVMDRSKRAPILTDTTLAGTALSARYAGKAPFEFLVSASWGKKLAAMIADGAF